MHIYVRYKYHHRHQFLIATFTLPTPQSSFTRSRPPPRPGVRWHGWPAVLRCKIQVSADISVASAAASVPCQCGARSGRNIMRACSRTLMCSGVECQQRGAGCGGGGGPASGGCVGGMTAAVDWFWRFVTLAGGAGLRRGAVSRLRPLLGQRLRWERGLGGDATGCGGAPDSELQLRHGCSFVPVMPCAPGGAARSA